MKVVHNHNVGFHTLAAKTQGFVYSAVSISDHMHAYVFPVAIVYITVALHRNGRLDQIMSNNVSVYVSFRLSVCPPVRQSVCPSVCLTEWLFIHICPSVRLFVCLSIYPSHDHKRQEQRRDTR